MAQEIIKFYVNKDRLDVVDNKNPWFKRIDKTYYSQNPTIKNACLSKSEGDAADQLRNDSIYYVPNISKLIGAASLPLLMDSFQPIDTNGCVNLDVSTITLLLKPSPDSDDLELLFPPSSTLENLVNYSFLDKTLTWRSKNGDTIVGGVILAIKNKEQNIWTNKTLLGAINATLKKLSNTPTIHSPQQKIIFGPPGTGKSYSVEQIKDGLYVNNDTKNKEIFFRTTFHPEYSYGDFVAKLLPLTVGDKVRYDIHAGPFIQALAKALSNDKNHVLLVIDEINRGNCAAIFGDTFQLLDRNDSGKSEYEIDPSELTRLALEKELKEKLQSEIKAPKTLCIPANLSIVATMNTSDESVFYMDSAFKRRWQFQYIGPDDNVSAKTSLKDQGKIKAQEEAKILNESGVEISDWKTLRNAINKFMVENSASVRRIEDKQLGLWFIKAKFNADETKGEIAHEDIQFKLMHYLWDNVFARDKEPLRKLLDLQKDEDKTKLVTFGQFADEYDDFLKKIIEKYPPDKKNEATQ